MFRLKLNKLIQVLQARDHRPRSIATWLGNSVHNDELMEIALKDLPRNRIISEIIASKLAVKLKMEVPEPFLVEVNTAVIKENNLQNGICALGDTKSRMFFASRFLKLPLLGIKGGYDEHLKANSVVKSASFAKLILFDLIIANEDRPAKNLFYVDKTKLEENSEVVVFDQDQALFGLDWSVDHLNNKIGDISRTAIDNYAVIADKEVKEGIVELAERWANTTDIDCFTIIDDLPLELNITKEEADIIKYFINTRIKNIVSLSKGLLKV